MANPELPHKTAYEACNPDHNLQSWLSARRARLTKKH